MSDEAVPLSYSSVPVVESPSSARAFIGHAKLIAALTFVSRVLGLARESVGAYFFGATAILSAFKVAFTIPNLFRKLFGEGALSAAFIPLYAQSVKTEDRSSADFFAAASVNLLCVILITLTVIGEGILWAVGSFWDMPPDKLLAVKLTAVMLPYVLLVCGTAFLSSILQVHRRFAVAAASPIVLNLCLIIAIVIGAKLFDLSTPAGQERGVWWLSVSVLVAGVLQVLMLLPSLRAIGFRFQPALHFWTPAIRKMLKLTLPVALGAGVLQLSVVFDKGISLLLAQSVDRAGVVDTNFSLLGRTIEYPMKAGAVARLDVAQYMYQFPLGVFAIALATAIFPKLSADALDIGREQFRSVLRRGIEATLFIGLPASVGMIVVRYPAVQLLFEHGKFTYADTVLVARSLALYSAAIWAFSLQQILNRAYYALHDTTTPLVLSLVTLALNLLVEIPLIWTPLEESGMAAGTCASFAVQSLVMLWMLSRKVGGLGLRGIVEPVLKMLLAAAAMWGVCMIVQRLPVYPTGTGKLVWLTQLLVLMTVGGVVYLLFCAALGIGVMEHLMPRRRRTAPKQQP